MTKMMISQVQTERQSVFSILQRCSSQKLSSNFLESYKRNFGNIPINRSQFFCKQLFWLQMKLILMASFLASSESFLPYFRRIATNADQGLLGSKPITDAILVLSKNFRETAGKSSACVWCRPWKWCEYPQRERPSWFIREIHHYYQIHIGTEPQKSTIITSWKRKVESGSNKWFILRRIWPPIWYILLINVKRSFEPFGIYVRYSKTVFVHFRIHYFSQSVFIASESKLTKVNTF